ncbi:MAG: hypothetical protein JWL72_1559 [Ilumatobacteraceae bacterium]|nr:hypothetical protein [Ilumatobacteraceae bacterium]
MITDVKPAKLLAAAMTVSLSIGAAACSSDSKPNTTALSSTNTPSSAATSDSGSGSGESDPTSTPTINGVQTYTGLSRNHTTDPVDYPQSPPVGGNHNPVWQNCGVYDTPVQNEHAVHSLEHGAVWITYRPNLPAAQVAVLAGFAVNQTHVLVSPYPGLSSPVVVTAWGVQLKLESVVDPRLAQFVAYYQEGPQTPELGITCSGGFGDPIS